MHWALPNAHPQSKSFLPSFSSKLYLVLRTRTPKTACSLRLGRGPTSNQLSCSCRGQDPRALGGRQAAAPRREDSWLPWVICISWAGTRASPRSHTEVAIFIPLSSLDFGGRKVSSGLWSRLAAFQWPPTWSQATV